MSESSEHSGRRVDRIPYFDNYFSVHTIAESSQDAGECKFRLAN